MKIKRLIPTAAVALTLVAMLACGSATPTPWPTSTPRTAAPPPTATPAPTPTFPTNPVPRAELETAFGRPLSSGLSIADVVENALPSVVQIESSGGTGSGFIVNESGLVVTNAHVVEGSTRVSLRLVEGDRYQGEVTRRESDVDLAYVQIDAAGPFAPDRRRRLRRGARWRGGHRHRLSLGHIPRTGADGQRWHRLRQARRPPADGRIVEPWQQWRPATGYVRAGHRCRRLAGGGERRPGYRPA